MATKIYNDYSYKGGLEKNIFLKDICEDEKDGKFIYSANVNEDFSLGRFSVSAYMHGRCNLFALVAHEVTNLPIHILALPDYHFPPKEGDLSRGILLSHAFIDLGNGYVWDGSGISTIESTIEKFAEIEEVILDNDDAEFYLITNHEENKTRLLAMMKNGYICDFAKQEKESLTEHIKAVIELGFNKPIKEDSPEYEIALKLEENSQRTHKINLY